ncbi:MAG TPA: DMT family transporter [Chloroflexia bacterium]|nr:DMT family transporter [Chloroflexia bacterium]
MADTKLAEGRATEGPLTAVGPELAQLLVVGMWASTFVVTKAVLAEITPLAFIFARFALMTILAFAVLAARGRRAQWAIGRADLPRFLLVGICGYTLYQLGFVLGLDNTSPFSSSLLIAMVPFFTLVILAASGERARLGAWLGLGVALAGVVLFLADKSAAPGSLVGDLLSLGAAVAFAFYGVLNRRLTRDYPPETYTAYTVLLGSIPLLALSTPAALAQPWTIISVWGWIAIVYMVVLPVYVAYMLWNWAIARRGAAAATSLTLLVPIVSGTLSAIFFGEGFGPLKLIGAALVLAGLVMLRRQSRPAGA